VVQVKAPTLQVTLQLLAVEQILLPPLTAEPQQSFGSEATGASKSNKELQDMQRQTQTSASKETTE
jgi:hypothetical protein